MVRCVQMKTRCFETRRTDSLSIHVSTRLQKVDSFTAHMENANDVCVSIPSSVLWIISATSEATNTFTCSWAETKRCMTDFPIDAIEIRTREASTSQGCQSSENDTHTIGTIHKVHWRTRDPVLTKGLSPDRWKPHQYHHDPVIVRSFLFEIQFIHIAKAHSASRWRRRLIF